jgi:HSP20 family protein
MALPTRVNRGIAYDPFEYAQRELEGVLGRFLTNREDGNSFAPHAVDVREDADHIYVDADLPGYKKDDIDITLENQTLTITAVRSNEEKQNDGKGQLLLHERRYSRFQRSFTLPPTIDEQSVQAKLNDGVLSITLNKREETKPRKVQVS